MCQCSDDPRLVFHRLVTLELLIRVCRLSVHTELERPISPSGGQVVELGEFPICLQLAGPQFVGTFVSIAVKLHYFICFS